MRFLVALLLLSALPAQVVTIRNDGGCAWRGWKRVAVTQAPAHRSGWHKGTDALYVRGNGCVDIRVALESGQSLTLDLSTFVPIMIPVPQLPADPVAHFGQGGTNLTPQSLTQDGAAWVMVCDEATVTWYPWQPGWCSAVPAAPAGPVVAQGFVPFIGDASPWPDRDVVTLVWWRHIRSLQELGSALSDARISLWQM